MLFELTLFSSFTMYHLIIGFALFLALSGLIKVFKISAELQSWLWATAFVIATLVPFSAFIPDTTPTVINLSNGEVVSGTLNQEQVKDLMEGNDVPLEPQSMNPEWNMPGQLVYVLTTWLYAFLAVWALGSMWRIISILRSYVRTQKLVTCATQLKANHPVQKISSVPVLASENFDTPMATGLFSPTILMPTSMLDRFDNAHLVPIVLHELAHINRKDLWVGLFQEALAIIFWWSPIMRAINNKIHIARELACDLRAAKRLNSGKLYAQSLVDCAQLMVTERCNVQAMGLFSKKKELTYRVNEVLKMKKIKAPKVLTTAISCVALTMATVGMAQAFMPKINVTTVKQEANFFSELSRAKGEMLMEAIKNEDYGMINMMIKNGLDINTPIIGDGTALIVAVKTQNVDMINALINLGADVDQGAVGDGSPLIAASWKGNVDLARLLVEKGAKVDKIIPGDETALINASRRGHFEMVEFLVESGADVNLGMDVRTRGGFGMEYRSPLSMARTSEVREYLISKGATK